MLSVKLIQSESTAFTLGRVRTVMKNLEKSWNFKTAFSRPGNAHGLYRIFLLFPAAFDFKMIDIHTFIQ